MLSTGGVSVGEFDFVKEALDALGVERLFWKVAQKPGKPLTFGTPRRRGSSSACRAIRSRRSCASRSTCGRRSGGWPAIAGSICPAVDATLEAPMRKASKLTEFVRVRLARGAGGWIARPWPSQSSGVLTSMGGAPDCSSVRPSVDVLEAGTHHPVLVPSPETLACDEPVPELA